jgi:hypothetical protein
VRKMLSKIPTPAFLSFWLKNPERQVWFGKMAEVLCMVGMVVGFLVFFFCAESSRVMFHSVRDGVMEKAPVAPWVWLSGLGVSHPVWFTLGATFLGGLGLPAVFGIAWKSLPFFRGIPWWGLILLALAGVVFFTHGLMVWLVIGIGVMVRNSCMYVFSVPARLKARRHAYFTEHPEILASMQKARLESKLGSTITPARKFRL